MRDAMLTVLRQHPGETRWSGRSGSNLFAIAVKRLPSEQIRQQAGPALLNLTHMLAVQELLKAKSLLDRYAESGLTDATTLRQAVVAGGGQLGSDGEGSRRASIKRPSRAISPWPTSWPTSPPSRPISFSRSRLAGCRPRTASVMHAAGPRPDAAIQLERRPVAVAAPAHPQVGVPRTLSGCGPLFQGTGARRRCRARPGRGDQRLGPQAGPEFLEQAGDLPWPSRPTPARSWPNRRTERRPRD